MSFKKKQIDLFNAVLVYFVFHFRSLIVFISYMSLLVYLQYFSK